MTVSYVPGISASGALAPGLSAATVRDVLELLSSAEIAAAYATPSYVDDEMNAFAISLQAFASNASNLASGIVAFARLPVGTTSVTVCAGNDSRLSDARTPTAHNQEWSTITSTPTTVAGYGITDAVTLSGTQTVSNKTFTTITTTGISSFDKVRTSATNFETLTVDPITDASNYRIGSRVGSSGGTTRGIVFGSYNSAGTWSQWFATGPTGTNIGVQMAATWSHQGLWSLAYNGVGGAASAQAVVAGHLGFTAEFGATGAVDTRIRRASAGVIAVLASTSTSDSTTLGSLLVNAITASGPIVNAPSASVTLSTNGQFSVEITSNTTGNLVYRGSDGVTRRFAFTLS